MSPRPFILSLLATALAAHAANTAELCVRAGDAVGALDALKEAGAQLPEDEANFWRGRALTMLNRPEEAAACFQRVPKESPLYPYAAKGLIYCAWVCPSLDFARLVTPLTNSADAELSTLALAAVAEHELCYAESPGESPIYLRLKAKAAQFPELKPIARLLDIHNYRLRGDYDAGIDYSRELEQDTTLPPLMRQRVRLALAELYYAKEQNTEPQKETGDEGKGEETLLQFITANPETPLLDEAFRRLHHHAGATGSDYIRTKLRDWAEDTAHPKRASLALCILHRMSHQAGSDSTTLANRAAAELPGEPMTCALLQEHIRKLLLQNKKEEALRYFNLLIALQSEPDARTQFLAALLPSLQEPDTPQERDHRAMALFYQSARAADGGLRTPALVNALRSAWSCGQREQAEQLLAQEENPRSKCALLLVHAALVLAEAPERARQDLTAALLLDPTPRQRTDIALDLAEMDLQSAPEKVLLDLLTHHRAARSRWTEEQQLRYAALLEHAAHTAPAEKAPGAPLKQWIADATKPQPLENAENDPKPKKAPPLPHWVAAAATAEKADTYALLYCIFAGSESLSIKQKVALHLADRLAEGERHREALEVLQQLAEALPGGEEKAAALLYAGYEAARLSTQQSLEMAVDLYDQCARQSSSYATRAIIEKAATLVRLNHTGEALNLLHPLEEPDKYNTLSAENRAHLLTVLADAYGLDMTPLSLATAVSYSEQIAAIPGLPPAWQVRGYLQHAALCTRMRRHEAAHTAYRLALQTELNMGGADTPEPQHSRMLSYAAAGAIYQLLLMKRHQEAAELADTTATQLGKTPQGDPTPKSDSFRRWAQVIRQTNFLTPQG